MSIAFEMARWERVRRNAAAWWAGELDRPLLQVTVPGRDPGRPAPKLPIHNFTAFYGPDVSAEAIVDCWDYSLGHIHYLGDAFPNVRPNFGPGDMAAFLGADLNASVQAGTVWFHPAKEVPIEALHLAYRTDSPWLRRIADLCRVGTQYWRGQVLIGMTDLCGNLDIVSTFRPGQGLLLDLTDYPEAVKRVTWEVHDAWFRYYEYLHGLMAPLNPGYTDWAGLYSAVPYSMLQCDFAYMIGPRMFEEFVLPELQATCRRLGNPFYHLDGIGQLPHLDLLLGIPELKGIQWIPGAGQPDWKHWPEVYRRIRAAGKLIQVFGDLTVVDTLLEQLGSARGICYIGSAASEAQAREFLARYGAA